THSRSRGRGTPDVTKPCASRAGAGLPGGSAAHGVGPCKCSTVGRNGRDRGSGRRQFVYHARRSRPISDLQAQIDRLNAALQRWQQAEAELQPMEDRLANLSERGSEILNRLAAADERQARAVSEVEARLG